MNDSNFQGCLTGQKLGLCGQTNPEPQQGGVRQIKQAAGAQISLGYILSCTKLISQRGQVHCPFFNLCFHLLKSLFCFPTLVLTGVYLRRLPFEAGEEATLAWPPQASICLIFIFSLVGFKRNLSLLEILFHFSGGLNQMEAGLGSFHLGSRAPEVPSLDGSLDLDLLGNSGFSWLPGIRFLSF